MTDYELLTLMLMIMNIVVILLLEINKKSKK